MSKQTGRFQWVTTLARVMLLATIALVAMMVIKEAATIVDGIYYEITKVYSPNVSNSVIRPIENFSKALLLMVIAGWTVVFYGLVLVLVANEESVRATAGRLARAESLLDDQAASTRTLAELAALSDQAKSLLFRDREIEALREVLRDDLIRQDYETAEALVRNVEQRSGYADEAARLREEIQAARKASVEEKLDVAIDRIQKIIAEKDWDRADREAQRIVRVFPRDARVMALPEQIIAARTGQKRALLQEYGEAVRRNDVERGIELLKELDLYLTPQEAAALQESARGVFRAKLHNLGVQFAISVTDEEWDAAVSTGEDIVRQFPNSRMAHEVQEKMDLLRARAADQSGRA